MTSSGLYLIGFEGRNRTFIHGFKARCPAIRRPRKMVGRSGFAPETTGCKPVMILFHHPPMVHPPGVVPGSTGYRPVVLPLNYGWIIGTAGRSCTHPRRFGISVASPVMRPCENLLAPNRSPARAPSFGIQAYFSSSSYSSFEM